MSNWHAKYPNAYGEYEITFASRDRAKTKAVEKLCQVITDKGLAGCYNFEVVIRCRDCKHFNRGMAVGICYRDPERPIIPVPYNHFCSFGERETDGKQKNAD